MTHISGYPLPSAAGSTLVDRAKSSSSNRARYSRPIHVVGSATVREALPLREQAPQRTAPAGDQYRAERSGGWLGRVGRRLGMGRRPAHVVDELAPPPYLGTAATRSRRWILVGAGPVARRYLDSELAAGASLPLASLSGPASMAGEGVARAERVGGIPVAGTIGQLAEVARRLQADEVVILVEDIGREAAEQVDAVACSLGMQIRFVEPAASAPAAVERALTPEPATR